MAVRSIPVQAAVLCFLLGSAGCIRIHAQQPVAAQPLNASVSDIGTTFVFSPPPICGGCLETELGFQSVDDSRYVPGIATLALPKGHTDFSLLVSLLDSELAQDRRVAHFGQRLDFLLRQQLVSKGGFEFTAAPQGTVLVRGTTGGRAGASLAPQYGWGKNLAVLNLTWTAAVGVSAANPRSDYLTLFDYFRTLQARGTALFLGFQQEVTAGRQTAAVEQGLVIPFRDGQVELETAQLNLNNGVQAQFQARVIVNWGRVFRRASR